MRVVLQRVSSASVSLTNDGPLTLVLEGATLLP